MITRASGLRMAGRIAAACWLGAAVVRAGDVDWPVEWTAFGPVSPTPEMAAGQAPDPDNLLPGSALQRIPDALVVDGQTLPARPVVLNGEGRIDLGALFDGVERGKTVYLMAPLVVRRDTTLRMGAGADWWMQWWLNGKPVFDTLTTGNRAGAIAPDNHRFELELGPGENVLAVAVISGSNAFLFAAGEPAAGRNLHAEAMAAGRQKFARGTWAITPSIDYDGAAADFLAAAEAAQTDPQRADALLRWGNTLLADISTTEFGEVRAAMERVLPFDGLTTQRRSEAWRLIAVSHLLESEYTAARAAAAQAREVTGDPRLWPAARLVKAQSYLQQRDFPAAHRELTAVLGMDEVDRDVRWEAEALLAALPLVSGLRSDHPRLFFNADTWPAIKERALTAERDRLEALRHRADELSPADIISGDWGLRAMETAFVYRVTGDLDLLEKTKLMLRATTEKLLSWDGGFSSRSYPRIGWVAALDWIWNDLSAGERRAFARDMAEYLSAMYANSAASGHVRSWPHYYDRDVFFFGGLVLLEPDLDDVEFRRIFTVMATGLKHQQEGIQLRVDRAGDDGAWHLNAGYFLAELPTCYSWPFIHAWKSATRGHVPMEWYAIGVNPDYAVRQIVDMEPNFIRTFGYSRTASRMRSELLYDHLGHFIHLFGDTHPRHAAMATTLRHRLAAECGVGGVGSAGTYPVSPFLQTGLSAAPEPVLPDGLPVARHYENVGLVLMSSGFERDDTYALFAAGGGVIDSEHFDTAHFTIYKGGYLAVDSGGRGAEPHSSNYWNQTVAHNSVLIRNPDEVPVNRFGGEIEANSGGQRRGGQAARVLAFESRPFYAYVATDATGTYQEEKCAQMVRQFIYLPPDHFVVFDRVTATRAEFPKTWMLHTGNEPVVTGRELRAEDNRGRMFVHTLLPADAELEAIGGPGRWFWADGRSWPLPADWQYWRNIPGSSDEPGPSLGGWQVRVTPGLARTEDYFLHLIQTTDPAAEEMDGSELVEDGDNVRVTFAAGSREYEITLFKTGDVGGQIRITENGRTLTDTPLTVDVMAQAGLAPENAPPSVSK